MYSFGVLVMPATMTGSKCQNNGWYGLSLLRPHKTELLLLDIVVSEEIPDDIQHTKERNIYILHLEFQVPNEKEMVYRMAEYSIMLMRKYKIPVKQFVIFLKAGKPTMATEIDTLNHKYNYKLVRISEINYRLFLR